jgi:hypothetical protein
MSNVTGEDEVLRAAARMLNSDVTIEAMLIDGQERSRKWVAERLIDMTTKGHDFSQLISISNVLAVRNLFARKALLPDTEEAWRETLKLFTYDKGKTL